MTDKDVLWNDLNQLHDIMSSITIQENNPSEKQIEKEIEDFKEGIQYFIHDIIYNNILLYKEYHFEKLLFEQVYHDIVTAYNNIIDTFNFDIEYHLWDAIEIYFYKHNLFRSYSSTTIISQPDIITISKKLKTYENVEQPEQLTPEWYAFRREGLSASDLWKALDTQSQQNALIYSKCKPINIQQRGTNTESPCHNGHRFEPLSIIHYEFDFNTTVGEFGCIKHREHLFLRASPDGINTDKKSPLYGRLVEVKNPVSRKLTGTPKKEYWVQMQIQMEVWNLDECDFLETVFKTYESEEQFLDDGESFIRNNHNKRKGILVQFLNNGEPYYEYPPVDISKVDFDLWYDDIMELHSNMTWIKNIYWYLEDYSCVLVPRNRKWFQAALPHLQELWKTVLAERETGYDHRKPKKQKRKRKISPNSLNILEKETISIFKDSDVYTEVENKKIVIRIRTESFDETNKKM